MGPIILQHDTYQGTVNSQEEVIRSLKKKGYKLVSMSECLRIPVYTHSK
jgi:peptidoglycan/xylan/chitin deacetylase (PgdA/CDA1 family)